MDGSPEQTGEKSSPKCVPPAVVLTPSQSLPDNRTVPIVPPENLRVPIIPSENVLLPDGTYSPVVKELLHSVSQVVTDVDAAQSRSRAQSLSSMTHGTPRKFTRHKRTTSHGSGTAFRQSPSRRSLASLGTPSQHPSPQVQRSHSGIVMNGRDDNGSLATEADSRHHHGNKRFPDTLSLGSLGRRKSSLKHKGRRKRGSSLTLEPGSDFGMDLDMESGEHSGTDGDCESEGEPPDVPAHISCFNGGDDHILSDQSDISSFTISSSTNPTQPSSECSTVGSYVFIHSPTCPQPSDKVSPHGHYCRPAASETTTTPSFASGQNHCMQPSLPSDHVHLKDLDTTRLDKKCSPASETTVVVTEIAVD